MVYTGQWARLIVHWLFMHPQPVLHGTHYVCLVRRVFSRLLSVSSSVHADN